jgi:hypothetical protein
VNEFVFQNTTKIYFGRENIHALGNELLSYGDKVLLVYGGGSIKRIGLYDKIVKEIDRVGLELHELRGVEPNPRHTTVNRGADICKDKHINVILAVGGGSTIDCAKAIAAAAYYDGDCWDLVTGKVKVTNALPIITVLTVSATGSEMDCGGVISNMETCEKLAIESPLLQPEASFLNPENTYSVSAFQTACGCADILSHIFDCYYFTTQPKLQMVDGAMENIIRTVIKYAPVAIARPTDYEARANLMWASSWALNGFLETGVNQAPACHLMEHELSAYYDITHGLGLAIITPKWLKYILDGTTASQIKKFGVNIFGLDESLTDMDGARLAIDKLSGFLYDTLGLASTLTEIGIDDKNFAVMAKKACGGGVIQSFKNLTPSDVEQIYKMCL